VAQLSSPAAVMQWQTTEAGLFAIRSMASGVNMDDNTILPKVMELILSNNLPNHSKIRFAFFFFSFLFLSLVSTELFHLLFEATQSHSSSDGMLRGQSITLTSCSHRLSTL